MAEFERASDFGGASESLVHVGVKVRLNIIIDVQTVPIRRAGSDYPKAEVASHPLQLGRSISRIDLSCCVAGSSWPAVLYLLTRMMPSEASLNPSKRPSRAGRAGLARPERSRLKRTGRVDPVYCIAWIKVVFLD